MLPQHGQLLAHELRVGRGHANGWSADGRSESVDLKGCHVSRHRQVSYIERHRLNVVMQGLKIGGPGGGWQLLVHYVRVEGNHPGQLIEPGQSL